MAGQEEKDFRYTFADALALLGISKSTLDDWLVKAKLRKTVDRQRFPDDMRQRYLTKAQLEQLATAHRRPLTIPSAIDPLARLEAVDAALTERIEALERRVAALEGKQSDAHPSSPS